MCPQVTAIDVPIVCVCTFTTRLTLPINFSVPAVNFIGGVKAGRHGSDGSVGIFCLCVPRAQCGDHGLQGQDAPLIQVCNSHLSDYLGVGD